MTTLLAYGDSNTYGTLPIAVEGERNRLTASERWPGIVADTLKWDVIEEGLPGRTTCYPDVDMGPHMDGRVGLFIALESHGPIDYMTLMLGTNDLKKQFDLTPEQIGEGISTLLNIAQSDQMQDRHDGFEILLICPPPVLERGLLAERYEGAEAKAPAEWDIFQQVATAHDVAIMNAGEFATSSEIDGVHFGADQHTRLAGGISNALRGIAG